MKRNVFFRIDTGSDMSIIGSKFVKTSGSQILLRNSCQLKYTTRKDVSVKFKTEVTIGIGKCLARLSVFVVDMIENCLLGVDFLTAVNLKDVSEPIFNNFGSERKLVCSCIKNSDVVFQCSQFLEELFERETEGLSSSQKELFAKFLFDFQDVFSEKIIAGNFNIVEHIIVNVGNSDPIKQTPRRVPFRICEEVEKIMKDMKVKGVIEESKSS